MKTSRYPLRVLCLLLLLALALSSSALSEAVYDPDFETVNLDTGIAMRYAALGDVGNTPVVLVHGATDSYLSYSQVAPILAEAGYRVYVPELRGHGGTDKPEEGPYTLQMHVDDLSSLLASLDLDRPFLVGHSLGSFVVQGVAAEHGEALSPRGIVLIGTAAGTQGNETLTWMLEGDGDFPGVRAFMDGVPEAFIDEWVATDNPDPAFAERIREHALALPPYSWVHTFLGLEGADTSPLLRQITAPALILWGQEDTFFNEADQIKVLDALIASPHVEWIKLDGASHNTHWDDGQLKPVTDAMLAFFEKNR